MFRDLDPQGSLERLKNCLENDPDRFQETMMRYTDAILIMDSAGVIQSANLAASGLLGLPSDQLLGVSFGIPIVTLEKAELDIIHPGGRLYVAEMWLTQLQCEGEVSYLVALRDITERKKADAALKESEERYRMISELISDFAYILRVEVDGYLFLEWSMGSLVHAFDLDASDTMRRQDWLRFIHPDDHVTFDHIADRLMNGQPSADELRVITKDGHTRWLLHRAKPVWDSTQNRVTRISGIVEDITARKAAEDALQKSNETLSFWVNELKRRNEEVSLLNEMAELLQSCLNVDEAYLVVARYARKLFPLQIGALYNIFPSDHSAKAVAQWGDFPASEVEFVPEKCWAYRRSRVHLVADPDNDLVCLHVTGSGFQQPYLCIPMSAQGETLGILHLRGNFNHTNPKQWELLAVTVSERVALALANLKLRETLHSQAIRDALTGAFNRRYLEETLERELRRSNRHQRPLGLIMLDIDHFKTFNDRYGHDAGDQLLRSLAGLLHTHIREEDFTCRFGGDEFVLVLPESSPEIAFQRACQIQEETKRLNVLYNGQSLGMITISAGVACYPHDGLVPSTLIKAADIALLQAKQNGRSQVIATESGGENSREHDQVSPALSP